MRVHEGGSSGVDVDRASRRFAVRPRQEGWTSIVPISYRSIGPFVAASDYVLICAACFAAGYGYELLILHQIASFAPYFAIANISALLFVTLSQQLYRPTAFVSLSSQLRGVVFGWMVLLLIFLLTLFLLKISAHLSRGALTSFGVLGLATLLMSASSSSGGAGFAG